MVEHVAFGLVQFCVQFLPLPLNIAVFPLVKFFRKPQFLSSHSGIPISWGYWLVSVLSSM